MKLWNKGELSDKQIDNFTVGKDRYYDLFIAPYDCIATMAHAKMLFKIGILNESEKDLLLSELQNILKKTGDKTFEIENEFEDIHSKIEHILTQKLGALGKKIHTARSRNDQVLVALKLLIKSELRNTIKATLTLFELLLKYARDNKDILLPGYTHMQVAMPSSFGLWFSGYAECLIDDVRQLETAHKIADQNPLGTAAGYGTGFDIDREFTTRELNFSQLQVNPVAAQIGRGKLEVATVESLGAVATTLSKLAFDICLYMGQEHGFINFEQSITTGSSIMPHKKNPDVFELVRGKCNLIKGLGQQLQLLHTNLPSGYHREMQLTKGIVIEAFLEMKSCLEIMTYSLGKIQINKEVIKDSKYDYLFTVNTLEKWVKEGMPFRDAYIKMAEMIKNKKFKPNRSVHHTHIGSIGNLGLPEIQKKMKEVIKR